MSQPLTSADIIDTAAYTATRPGHRRRVMALKRDRRVAVGPDAAFYFENRDTVWYQIQEMLRIERGGDAQIPDELAAYNPLIPNGRELVATLMFEIDEPQRRAAVLGSLGGVEQTTVLQIGTERIPGRAEQDVDRTTAGGKASSVQFVHFDLTDAQAATMKAAAMKAPDVAVLLAIEHPQYGHTARLTPAVCAALAADLD